MPLPSVLHHSLKRCSHLVHDCIARERPQNHLQNSSSSSLFCHAQRELVINCSDQNHSLCWFFLLSRSTLTIHAQPFLNTSWANYYEQGRQCTAQFWEGGWRDCDGMLCTPYIMPLKYYTTEDVRLLKII